MKNKPVFYIGILGVLLFVLTSLIGGFLIEDYDILRQYISETYAIDTEYGPVLRFFGYIPSGVLLALFCFLAVYYFKTSNWTKIGFYSVGLFYGLATVVVSIFPCDSGCNRELINPSSSQLIHNLMGFLTYVIVPIALLLIGLGLKKQGYPTFSKQSIVLGGISLLFVAILMTNSNSEYVGLYQRLVELTFLLWIVLCAITIKNTTPASDIETNEL